MFFILTLGKQKQLDLCEFEASMLYRASFNTAGPQRNTVSRDKKASGLGMVIQGFTTNTKETGSFV